MGLGRIGLMCFLNSRVTFDSGAIVGSLLWMPALLLVCGTPLNPKT